MSEISADDVDLLRELKSGGGGRGGRGRAGALRFALGSAAGNGLGESGSITKRVTQFAVDR